jgi:small subunit ribosomal protein S5
MAQQRQRQNREKEASQFDERVIQINRVSKVVKGGRRFAFTALVCVGDGEGRVGLAYAKAGEVPSAIQKAMEIAKGRMELIPMTGTTLIHKTLGVHDAARVMLKPAAPGTGVIAGGAVRQILEAAGIKDVLAKSLGSATYINVARATMNGLRSQRRLDDVAKLRGKSPDDIFPPGLLAAYRTTELARSHGKKKG